jgi:bifunctional DNA-binding transcriptional regulator/antitoxin component of YhaV-PrlF toxin-antitoxin module
MKGKVTRVGFANKEKRTLRVTIPSHVRDYLELKQGDEIVWELDKTKDEWIATIRKVKKV